MIPLDELAGFLGLVLTEFLKHRAEKWGIILGTKGT